MRLEIVADSRSIDCLPQNARTRDATPVSVVRSHGETTVKTKNETETRVTDDYLRPSRAAALRPLRAEPYRPVLPPVAYLTPVPSPF